MCTLACLYNKSSFIVLLLALIYQVQAQNEGCNTEFDKRIEAQFTEACAMLEDSSAGAIPLLKKIVRSDTAYYLAWFKLGEAYYQKTIASQYDILLSSHTPFYFSKAESCFTKALQLCSEHNNYLGYYYLAELHFLQKNYKKADHYYNLYLPHANRNDEIYSKVSFCIELCAQWKFWHESPAQVNINAMDNLNTSNDELRPYIYHGANGISFLKIETALKPNSIYSVQQKRFNKAYIEGVNTLEQPIFTKTNQILHSIPKAFNIAGYIQEPYSGYEYFTLQVFRSNNKTYDQDCDIYISKPFVAFTQVDSMLNVPNAFDGEPTLSIDNNLIIFVSDRKGGYGGRDLYFSVRDSSGNWSKPCNMGATINTINDERTPFLHYDQQTLFYASNGRFGLGGFDIYKSVRINDSIWSDPLNLGMPINTYNDDLFFVVDARSNMGYFASDKLPGKGGWDIFSVNLPAEIAPKSNIVLNGIIIDETYKPVKDAAFSIVDVNTGTSMELVFNKTNGSFSVILPNETKNYLFTVNKKGYSFTNRFFSSHANQLMNFRTIQIYPIEIGRVFELSSLKYSNKSYLISNDNAFALNSFAEFLAANANLKFIIYGYYDRTIKNKPSGDLPLLRAKQVYNYLLKIGIDSERMQFKGKYEPMHFDDSSPIKFEILSK